MAYKAWGSLNRLVQRRQRRSSITSADSVPGLLEESALTGLAFWDFYQKASSLSPQSELGPKYCQLVQASFGLGKWAALIGWPLSEGLADSLVKDGLLQHRDVLERSRDVALSGQGCGQSWSI